MLAILGAAGVGKSSLIATFLALVSNRDDRNRWPHNPEVGQSGVPGHKTETVDVFNDATGAVRFIDTFGLPNSVKEFEIFFRHITQGKVAANGDMDVAISAFWCKWFGSYDGMMPQVVFFIVDETVASGTDAAPVETQLPALTNMANSLASLATNKFVVPHVCVVLTSSDENRQLEAFNNRCDAIEAAFLQHAARRYFRFARIMHIPHDAEMFRNLDASEVAEFDSLFAGAIKDADELVRQKWDREHTSCNRSCHTDGNQ